MSKWKEIRKIQKSREKVKRKAEMCRTKPRIKCLDRTYSWS